MTFYYENIVDLPYIHYSATEDTGYPIENILDTNQNIKFMDSAIGSVAVEIIIDFGSAKTVDYVLLVNHTLTASGTYPVINIYYSSNDITYTQADGNAYIAGNQLIEFTEQSYRYWKIEYEMTTGTLTNLEIGSVFIGSALTLTTSPEIDINEIGGYDVLTNEGAGGQRFSIISNETIRRTWEYSLKYITSTEKTNLEDLRDTIFMSDNLSRYPMFFSPDDGTTLYYARTINKLNFTQIAYQRYESQLTLDEEL